MAASGISIPGTDDGLRPQYLANRSVAARSFGSLRDRLWPGFPVRSRARQPPLADRAHESEVKLHALPRTHTDGQEVPYGIGSYLASHLAKLSLPAIRTCPSDVSTWKQANDTARNRPPVSGRRTASLLCLAPPVGNLQAAEQQIEHVLEIRVRSHLCALDVECSAGMMDSQDLVFADMFPAGLANGRVFDDALLGHPNERRHWRDDVRRAVRTRRRFETTALIAKSPSPIAMTTMTAAMNP